jgi:haloalkane dehalogenase
MSTGAGSTPERLIAGPALQGGFPARGCYGAEPPKALLPRMQATFPRNVTVGLPRAKHYVQEDAPGEIAQAIVKRFG